MTDKQMTKDYLLRSAPDASSDIESIGIFELDYFGPSEVPSVFDILNGFLPVLVVAFFVTLVAVPIVRKIATANDIIDHHDKVSVIFNR